MYKYNPFIMQNIRANTLIIGANNNPINKKVRLNADFSINYKKNSIIICSFIEKQLCLHGKFLRYLRSNGKNHVINNYVKGNENERLFTFLFFKFINLKFSIMNKKFLSVILFSALMVGTAGTFTSCKDYDDDIKDLQGQVDGLAGDVKKLQGDLTTLGTTVDNLTYVKDAKIENGKLVVVDKNGNPHSYDIPAGVTYTLSVSKDGDEVTISLKGSDGSTSDVKIDMPKGFDATLLSIDKDGNILYDDEKTGGKIDLPTVPTLTMEILDEDGVKLGYIIKYGSATPINLRISDVLPITSFEYIPESILQGWGERVIVFHKDSYKPVEIKNDAVVALAKTNYLPNQAAPQFHVNPSSATQEQITKTDVLDKTVTMTKGVNAGLVTWKNTVIEGGLATVTLEANPNLFANSSLTEDNEKPELNEIALQFTTKAGNKVTTEYVGVVNRTEELKLVLADKEVTSENAKDDKCHFATNLAAAEEQKAKIGVDNKPAADNNHLVQNVVYDDAVSEQGIDLKTLVTTCNIAGSQHKFFNYANYADTYELTFEAVEYKVNNTPQENYMTLEDGIFHAKNYGGVDKSAIGKSPIVLAKLTDKTNNNELVAAAWIKLLIVAGEVSTDIEDDYVAEKKVETNLGCNSGAGWTYETEDEFMSAQVYNFKNNADLEALSKQQWHHIYAFDEDATTKYAENQVGDWTITATEYDENNEANQVVKFVLKTTPFEVKSYVGYAVFTKTTEDTKLDAVANSRTYPENVVIKYVVEVKNIDFTANTPQGSTAGAKIAEYWSTFKGKSAIDIYCATPDDAGTTTKAVIEQDLLSNFYGRTVALKYNKEDAEEKYPSFAHENMTVKFVFSAENNKRIVKGNDGKNYELFVNADGTQIHALEVLEGDFTVIASDENVIATLSENETDDNGTATETSDDVTIAENIKISYQSNDVAKAVLNWAARDTDEMLYATIDMKYYNGCDQYVPVTDGTFNAKFIRPVNISGNEGKYFEDGNNEGKSVLNLGDLVVLKDWRLDASSGLNEFSEHLNYYKYYNVTAIKLAEDKDILTNLNNSETFVPIEEVFGKTGAETLLTFDPKLQTYENVPTEVPNFGTVTYNNKDVKVHSSFYLRIPIEVVYVWGSVIEEIDVEVKPTL